MSDAAPETAVGATAEALARRLLRDLPPDRPRDRGDLAGLPSPVAALLAARLDAEADAVATDAPWSGSPWVNADADAVAEAARTWRGAVRAAARFPAGAWAGAVEEETRRALAHLVHPAETLAAWAFRGGQEPLPADVVLERIRVFEPYPYLVTIAERYVERKGLGTLDRTELGQTLSRIDRRMASTFGPDDWAATLEPLYALAGGLGERPGAVPAALLRPLLRAKGADALADALPNGLVERDALRRLAAGVLEAAAPEPDPEGLPPAPEAAESRARAEVPEADLPEADPAVPLAEPAPEAEPDGALAAHGAEASPTGGGPSEAGSARPGGGEEPTGDLAAPEPEGAEAREGRRAAGPADAPAQAEVPAPAANAPETAGPEESEPDEDLPDEDLPDEDLPGTPLLVPDEPDAGDPEPAPPPAPSASAPRPPDETERAHRPPARPDESDPAGPDPVDVAPGGPVPDAVPAPAPADTAARPDAPPPPPPEELTRTEEPEPRPAPPAREHEADTDGPDGGEEPLWRRLARQQGAAAEPPAEPVREPEDEPLWTRFVQADAQAKRAGGPDAGPSPAALPELDAVERRVLGDGAAEQRAWYVAELFEGSDADYHRTLAALDGAASWTEATQIIARDVFRKHRVNIYSEPAVAFTDAVEAQTAR
jgi:hypothetical protein